MPKKGQRVWTKARKAADPEGWAQEQASRRAAQKAYNAQHYAKNKDKVLAQNAQYRAKNKDKVLARNAQYRAKNKDKVLAQKAKHYAKNKDTLLARHAQKEVFIQRLSNHARKRHIEKGFPAETFALTPAFIEELCAKQNGQCFYTYVVLEFAPNKPGTASPDRIDNSRGYEADNVVLTTTAWNNVRKGRSIEEALEALIVHAVALVSRKGPRGGSTIVRRALALINPAEGEAFLRQLTPQKKSKRATAEVLPLFGPMKESA
jgi:hypothetical protein